MAETRLVNSYEMTTRVISSIYFRGNDQTARRYAAVRLCCSLVAKHITLDFSYGLASEKKTTTDVWIFD